MGSIYCWFRGSTSKSKGGERGRGTGGKSRSCQETVWTLCTRSWPSQVRAIKLRIALGVGDIIEKNLSAADISEFFELSANYRYRILGIWELSKNYRYRKLHPILSDKHNWKHCSKNEKGTTTINRKAACCQRLLVQQSQHRQFQCLWEVHWWCQI